VIEQNADAMRACSASNGTRAPRWRAAPADIRLGRGEVHVWLVDLDGDPPAAGRPATLEDALSADERARASRLRSEPLRRRFVAGRIAMRSILGRYPGVGAPRDLQFAYGPHGRPSLAARNGPHFNFTRSGPLALCAVARTTAVGVDVECVRAIPEAASITRQYFSAREQAALASLDMPPESAVGYQAALAIRARGVTLRFWRWSAD
jgi:4'-phosphopantetheinyl transferase